MCVFENPYSYRFFLKKLADCLLLRMVCMLLFSSVILNLFVIRDPFPGRQSSHRWWQGMGVWLKHITFIIPPLISQEAEVRWTCEQWDMTANTKETSLAHRPLISCCVAQFLTGHQTVLVHGLWAEDPWSGWNLNFFVNFWIKSLGESI